MSDLAVLRSDYECPSVVIGPNKSAIAGARWSQRSWCSRRSQVAGASCRQQTAPGRSGNNGPARAAGSSILCVPEGGRQELLVRRCELHAGPFLQAAQRLSSQQSTAAHSSEVAKEQTAAMRLAPCGTPAWPPSICAARGCSARAGCSPAQPSAPSATGTSCQCLSMCESAAQQCGQPCLEAPPEGPVQDICLHGDRISGRAQGFRAASNLSSAPDSGQAPAGRARDAAAAPCPSCEPLLAKNFGWRPCCGLR